MILVFDCYGTLMRMHDFYGRLHSALQEHGVSASPEVVRAAAHDEMRHYMKGACGARCLDSWHELRRECADVLSASLSSRGVKPSLSQAQWIEVLTGAVQYRALPGVRAALEELRARGHRLAVLSNWDFRLAEALDEAGLLDLFDWTLASAQVGVAKPARALFDRGLERARLDMPGLQAQRCFYVGDHFENDVVGAHGAGWRPIWLVRDDRDLTSGDAALGDTVVGTVADVPRLRDLRDLPRLLGGLVDPQAAL